MTTMSINRRSKRNQRARDQSRASNDRCASALKKTQLRDGSCDEGHIAIDTTMMMITTIVIGTAMAAELDASNATINEKATTWRWASAESAASITIVERDKRRQDVKVGRNDRDLRRRDKAHTNTKTIATIAIVATVVADVDA